MKNIYHSDIYKFNTPIISYWEDTYSENLNLELQGSTFLKECKKPDLIFHEVSKDVNKPTNNTASLIQPI